MFLSKRRKNTIDPASNSWNFNPRVYRRKARNVSFVPFPVSVQVGSPVINFPTSEVFQLSLVLLLNFDPS